MEKKSDIVVLHYHMINREPVLTKRVRQAKYVERVRYIFKRNAGYDWLQHLC